MDYPDHYHTLNLPTTATQAEIKRAYRQLAKQFHPDSQTESACHERITRINAAYEVLGDPEQRQRYDQTRADGDDLNSSSHHRRTRHKRTVDMQNQYRRQREATQDVDAQIQVWLKKVYRPVDRLVAKIINPLKGEIRDLSADPFDDRLMEDFQTYLDDCRTWLEQAQLIFKSMPNPAEVAGTAANLYYCLNQLEDGLEEMERFTYNYDDSYLHTGQELFRISARFRREAKASLQDRIP